MREAFKSLIVSEREERNWMYFKEPVKVVEEMNKLKDENVFLAQLNQDEQEELDRIQQTNNQEIQKLFHFTLSFICIQFYHSIFPLTMHLFTIYVFIHSCFLIEGLRILKMLKVVFYP